MELLAAAKRHEIGRLWVKNLSRLFRNLAEQTVYLSLLEKAGVKVITLQEPSEGEKPILDLTRNVLGSVNQYLAAAVGQQIKAANRIIASTGRYIGGKAPLGYRYDKDSKELTLDPLRLQDAVTVFRLYAEERNFSRVAVRLNRAGIRTRDGYLWRWDKVKAIITSPIYRGQVHYCGETWPGKHESLSDNLLRQVDEILKTEQRMNKARGKVHTNVHTYTRLLRCGLCGTTIRAKPRKQLVYWVCSMRQDRGLCEAPAYRTDDLDRFVLEGLKLTLTKELDKLKAFAEAQPDVLAQPRQPDDRQARLAALRAKMQRVATEYAEGYMERDEYRVLTGRYRQDRKELEAVEQKDEAPRRVTAHEVEQFQARLSEEWGAASEAERHAFVRAVAPRITVYPDKLILHTRLSIGDVEIRTGMFVRKAGSSPAGGASHTYELTERGKRRRRGKL